VINVGSILGRVTFPFFGIYGASKFAVEALTDSFRYELSQLGVDVVLVQPCAYPTSMYSTAQRAADARRSTEYGDIGQIPSKLFARFTQLFEAPNAPDPHDVAEVILGLIARPKGERPVRTVVGTAFGADVVNAQVAPVQSQVVEGLGLGTGQGHLTRAADRGCLCCSGPPVGPATCARCCPLSESVSNRPARQEAVDAETRDCADWTKIAGDAKRDLRSRRDRLGARR
jgi:short subunit dehydrogenase